MLILSNDVYILDLNPLISYFKPYINNSVKVLFYYENILHFKSAHFIWLHCGIISCTSQTCIHTINVIEMLCVKSIGKQLVHSHRQSECIELCYYPV